MKTENILKYSDFILNKKKQVIKIKLFESARILLMSLYESGKNIFVNVKKIINQQYIFSAATNDNFGAGKTNEQKNTKRAFVFTLNGNVKKA